MAVAATKQPSGATPASITIPATPAERNLLSAASAWIPPSAASDYLRSPARGGAAAAEHSITAGDLAEWRGQHPSDPLRPPAGVDNMDKGTLKNYRPPQHPTSRLLQSIPPRAPSRSSRANILSYTLHLATSSRLTSYSSGSGSRQLLQLAELERDTQDTFEIDEAWFDAEQKTQGLWKLGANLLRSSRREGVLPASVLRRVELAELAEETLLSPAADRAVTKIDAESVQPSAHVEELVTLKALTAPDPTTLYHTTSASTTGLEGEPSTGRPRVCSVAQSLIDLKFGGQADPAEATSPVLDGIKPLSASPRDGAEADAPGASGSGSSAAAAVAGPSSTPHMDYRIVLSQSMRARARSIFATSPLPALPASYCRRHRVRSCGVCHALIAAASDRQSDHASMRRKNIPGAGLRAGDLQVQVGASGGAGVGAKKPLAQLIPEFLKLSAALLRDVKEAANRRPTSAAGPNKQDQDAFHEAILADLTRMEDHRVGGGVFTTQQQQAGKTATEGLSASASSSGIATPLEVVIQVTAAWYDLLTGLLVQACLEGYLVDGWTGTEGVETLFGLGCGVWEGRGWSATAAFAARQAAPVPRSETSRPSRTVSNAASDDSEGDDDDDDAIDEATALQRKKDHEAALLVEAGQALFGSRDIAQADYERNMRDRTQEFLNVPNGKTLHQHLDSLNMQYPLSQFEDDLVDFLEASMHFLGKPALAKYDPRATAAAPASSVASSTAGSTTTGEPDPYALLRWFAPAASGTVSPPERPRSGAAGRQASPSGQDERSRKRARAA
ncbi:hypothetical protein JCM3774_005418 [Rhodotorula dairenensis]